MGGLYWFNNLASRSAETNGSDTSEGGTAHSSMEQISWCCVATRLAHARELERRHSEARHARRASTCHRKHTWVMPSIGFQSFFVERTPPLLC